MYKDTEPGETSRGAKHSCLESNTDKGQKLATKCIQPSRDNGQQAHHCKDSVPADDSQNIGEQNTTGSPCAVLATLLFSSLLTDKQMRRSCSFHTAV